MRPLFPPDMRPPPLAFSECGGACTVQLCLLQHRLMSIKKDWHARMSPPLQILGDDYLPRPALFALAQMVLSGRDGQEHNSAPSPQFW